MVKRTCSIDGCTNKHEAHGWCENHYKQKVRSGDFQPRKQIRGICDVEGCGGEHRARGYCNKHYLQWRRTNNPSCSVNGCDRSATAREYCDKHWKRVWKHGDPQAGTHLYSTPEESFAARTEWQGDCLVWTGLNQYGYGIIAVNRRSVLAHRYAWENKHGAIPEGAQIDHRCWNPSCVNVEHLRLASPAENSSYLSGPAPNTSTGVRNVHYNGSGKYRVRIKVRGKEYYFGLYEKIEDAADVAERERKRLFGDFAGRG